MEQTQVSDRLLPTGRNQWLVYVCCLMVFAGFSCSRALISMGVIGLIITGFLIADIRQTFKTYTRHPAFYINALFFVVILLSGINSENQKQWLTFLQIKISFLLLPFAFCGFAFFDRPFFNKLLFAFLCCMCVSASCVLINYALHYDQINLSIVSGSTVPVPFSHIRYTLLLAFSFFIAVWLWEQWRSYFLLTIVAFLFITIHILSSRSGWLALYAGLLFYLAVYIYQQRKFIAGFSLLISIIVLPFVLYHVMPSFHNKIDYMRYNVSEYQAGHIDDLSDAMRFSSWQTGVEIIKRNPITGTGVGDLLQVSKQVSKELFPTIKNDDDRKMPHNEFIWIWAATGIFGFLAYCFAFLYPLIINIRQRNWLFIILYIIFLTSFLTEYSLEEQIGSTFYLLFLLIFLTHFHSNPAAHD